MKKPSTNIKTVILGQFYTKKFQAIYSFGSFWIPQKPSTVYIGNLNNYYFKTNGSINTKNSFSCLACMLMQYSSSLSSKFYASNACLWVYKINSLHLNVMIIVITRSRGSDPSLKISEKQYFRPRLTPSRQGSFVPGTMPQFPAIPS